MKRESFWAIASASIWLSMVNESLGGSLAIGLWLTPLSDRISEKQDRRYVEAENFWLINALLQTLSTNFQGITGVAKSTCNVSRKYKILRRQALALKAETP